MTSEERRRKLIERAFLGAEETTEVPAAGTEAFVAGLSRAVAWHLGSEGATPPARRDRSGRHGTADAWTSSTLTRHLRETAPDGMTAGQVRDVVATLHVVVEWRRHLTSRDGPADPRFADGRRCLGFGGAAARAERWAAARSAQEPARHRVIRLRDAFAVVGPAASGRDALCGFHDGPVWEGEDRGRAAEIAKLLNRHDAEREWRTREVSLGPLPTPLPGVTVTVSKEAGSDCLNLTVLDGDREVGSFLARLANREACLAANRVAVMASRWLDDAYVGRGLGAHLHDMVEEVCGMPLVPHEINGARGHLSRHAQRFYVKRMVDRYVPGFGDRDRERHAELAPFVALTESRGCLPSDEHKRILSRVAEVTGGVLETFVDAGGSERSLPWLSLPDGTVLTCGGAHSRAALLDAGRMDGPDWVVRQAGEPRGRGLDHVSRTLASKLLYDSGLSDVEPELPDAPDHVVRALALRDAVVAEMEEIRAARTPCLA